MLRLSKSDTVAMQVRLSIPTDKPTVFNEGTIDCQVKILSKQRLKELQEQETGDAEYLKEILQSVTGLGDADGNPLVGEEALANVYEGTWSTFLQPAIVQSYFAQFVEARVKNSKPLRGR